MMIIKNFFIFLLQFPTSHRISGWQDVRHSDHLLVIVITDEGSVGLGEGTPYSTSLFSDYIFVAKFLKNANRENLEEVLNKLRYLEENTFLKGSRVNYGAFLALESALLDALGKARGFSITDVLGGVYRTVVPVAGTVFLDHPLKMVERIKWWLRKGVKHVKLKIPCSLNLLELYLDIITRMTRLKDKGITLRVDANECFRELDKAYKALQIMTKYGVDIVEQLMPRDRLREMAKLRKAFSPSIKLMLDESLVRPQDLEVFAAMEVADIVNFHPSKLGCLSITREAILEAKKLGFEVNIGSSLMTEIGLAHYLHLASSLPELDYPLEEVGIKAFYPQYSVLRQREKIFIVDGYIKLPSNSGSGFEFRDLNTSLLNAYATSLGLKDIVSVRLATLWRLLKQAL